VTALPPIGAVAPEQLNGVFPDDLVAPPTAPAVAGAPNAFGDLVTEGLNQVNEKLRAGEAGLQRLATGDMQNLHQVMIQLEESRLSFQLLMQVRNRLLEAYQDVMKMQV
jgi:flagellar hook-basal body complex protein FliE